MTQLYLTDKGWVQNFLVAQPEDGMGYQLSKNRTASQRWQDIPEPDRTKR